MGTYLFERRYKLTKLIGQGSFGQIHHAIDLNTGEEVAIKSEALNAAHPQLMAVVLKINPLEILISCHWLYFMGMSGFLSRSIKG